MAKEGLIRRFFMRLGSSVLDWVIANPLEVIGLIGTLGIVSLLAYITDWLSAYNPLAAGLVGIGAACGVAMVYAFSSWLLSIARMRVSQITFAEERAKLASVNPLQGAYHKLPIKLSDFFHPFYQSTENAKFEDCDLFGPSAILIEGSQIRGNSFSGCQAVVIKKDVRIIGATGFRGCMFVHCRFFQVTLYMAQTQYQQLKDDMGEEQVRKNLPMISDGTVGDL